MTAPRGVEVDEDKVEGRNGGIEVGIMEFENGAVGGEVVGGD